MHLHFLITILSILAPIYTAKSLDSQIVIRWNNALLDAIRQESTPPSLASRNLALLHLAMFDAVNAIDQKYQGIHYKGAAPHGLQPSAVATGAAQTIAQALYPSQESRFSSRDLGLGRDLEPHLVNSKEFGAWVANQLLKDRGNDNTALSVTYIPKTSIGQWTRTPPYFKPPEMPHWPKVKTLVLEDPTIFKAPGPPSMTSSQYALDLEEVRSLGGLTSSTRTKEQTEIANFWSCFSYTATPAGHWNEIASRLIVERRIQAMDALFLMALLNAAMADAGIVAWQEKYDHHLWRPIHAIRKADQDGNDKTQADPNWRSLLEAPPHPEYVSGHSVFSGSGAEILRLYLGTDQIAFSANSDSLPGTLRHFESISECEEEIALSRIYGGIHYRFSAIDGLKLGHAVAQEVFQKFRLQND